MNMVAGIETLNILKEGEVYKGLDYLGKKATAGLEEVLGRGSIDASITGVGSLFAVHFQKEKPGNAREVAKNNEVGERPVHVHVV